MKQTKTKLLCLLLAALMLLSSLTMNENSGYGISGTFAKK